MDIQSLFDQVSNIDRDAQRFALFQQLVETCNDSARAMTILDGAGERLLRIFNIAGCQPSLRGFSVNDSRGKGLANFVRNSVCQSVQS